MIRPLSHENTQVADCPGGFGHTYFSKAFDESQDGQFCRPYVSNVRSDQRKQSGGQYTDAHRVLAPEFLGQHAAGQVREYVTVVEG